jgi:hypothetical protein
VSKRRFLGRIGIFGHKRKRSRAGRHTAPAQFRRDAVAVIAVGVGNVSTIGEGRRFDLDTLCAATLEHVDQQSSNSSVLYLNDALELVV